MDGSDGWDSQHIHCHLLRSYDWTLPLLTLKYLQSASKRGCIHRGSHTHSLTHSLTHTHTLSLSLRRPLTLGWFMGQVQKCVPSTLFGSLVNHICWFIDPTQKKNNILRAAARWPRCPRHLGAGAPKRSQTEKLVIAIWFDSTCIIRSIQYYMTIDYR